MSLYRSYYNVSDTEVDSRLIESCAFYAEGHSVPGPSGYTTVATTCQNIAPPRVALNYTGGPWAGFHVRATFSRYANSDGRLLDTVGPGNYGTGVGGCDDSRNANLVAVGSDGQCYCLTGYDWDSVRLTCVSARDRYFFSESKQCQTNPSVRPKLNPSVYNPIYPLMGTKRQSESLGFSIGREEVAVVFDTISKVGYAAGSGVVNGSSAFAVAPPVALPGLWSSTLHKRLTLTYSQAIQAYRGANRWVSFTRSGSTYVASAAVNDVLVASGGGWRYVDKSAGIIETYDGSGRILSAKYRDGTSLSYGYSTSTTPASQAGPSSFRVEPDSQNRWSSSSPVGMWAGCI